MGELIPDRSNDSGDDEYNWIAEQTFGTLMKAVITLFRLMNFDGTGALYRTLILKGNPVVIIPFFVAYIAIASIALMNFVTALMVESSIEKGRQDRTARLAWEQAKKRSLIPKIKKAF